MINGSVAPTGGFGSHATADRRPSYSLPATIVPSTPTPPGSWLNSMIRNGEVERIARSERTSPSPMWRVTPAFEPDAVDSPDGYFAGNFPTAFPPIAPPAAVPSSRNAASQDREGPFDTRFGSWGSVPANASGSDQRRPRYSTRGRLQSAISLRRSSRRLPIVETLSAAQATRSLSGYAGWPRRSARRSCRSRSGQADRDAADF